MKEVAKKILNSQMDIAKILNGIDAAAQLKTIKAIESLLTESGITADPPQIVDQIIMGQNDKVARFGSRAYKMSEAQVAVIANYLSNRRAIYQQK